MDPARIPYGILLDRALPLIDPSKYDGSPGASPATAFEFGQIYHYIVSGQIPRDSSWLPSIDRFDEQWFHDRTKFNEQSSGHIVLAGMYVKYARLDSMALDEERIRWENYRLYDAYDSTGQWQNPYLEKELFIITPPVDEYKWGNVTITLPDGLLVSNVGNSIQSIELDPGDGQGYRPLTGGNTITTQYTTDGTYRWTFRMLLADGTSRYASADIDVYIPDLGSNICSHTNIYDVRGAVLRIDYAPSHNCQIRKPLIVVEGFDALSYINPENAHGDLSLRNFLVDFHHNGTASRLDQLLHNPQEYDVIYVDWKDGTANIFTNARILQNVIKWVNRHKVERVSNVVLGQSMGGLVARVALRKMEDQGIPHETRLFIAHDSPMQGAVVPAGLQYFYRILERHYHQLSYLLGLFIIQSPVLIYYYGFGYRALNLLDRPASKQMLYYRINYIDQLVRRPHWNFQEDLERVGYPQQTRNVVISNGNECGHTQGFQPYDPYIDLDTTGYSLGMEFINKLRIRSNPMPNASEHEVLRWYLALSIRIQRRQIIVNLINKRRNIPSGILPYDYFSGGYYLMDSPNNNKDNIPGIVNRYFGFIPVPSALDIHKQSGDLTFDDYLLPYGDISALGNDYSTPFDNYLVDYKFGKNRPHISFQSRNGDWMADEMENPPAVASHCLDYCDAGGTAIEGPQVVCSTADYHVSGYDFLVWTDSCNFVDMASPNVGEMITLESNIQNATGPGRPFTLYAQGYSSCTGSISLERTLWVGNPSFGLVHTGNYPMIELSLTDFDPDLQGVTDVEWEIESNNPDNTIIAEDMGTATAFISPTDNVNITATATNDCGSYSQHITINSNSNFCANPNHDLILIHVENEKYRLYDPCHPNEEKYISNAEIYDQFGVKLGNLTPVNNNKELNIHITDPNAIRIIKVLSQDGKLARKLIIVN